MTFLGEYNFYLHLYNTESASYSAQTGNNIVKHSLWAKSNIELQFSV
jgi:hypothetical protein